MQRDGKVLQVHDLVVCYGDVVAVDHVTISALENDVTALVGPSGCGKTSLLRAIAGFELPVNGSVTIGGRVVAASDSWVAPEHRSVGMVFQQGALFPHLTVRQNVEFGVRRRRGAESRTQTALELVGLSDLQNRFPDELSGGQQQRVALARALAPSPEVVLLDEPFANLDAALRQRVREEVCAILKNAGATAVIVTHDQEEALSVADRLAVMKGGRILQEGTPQQVYRDPRSIDVAEFIGDGQLVACKIDQGRLQSELGNAECDAGADTGLLLVRPEDLMMLPDSSGRGVPGQITQRRFFGHDQLCRVRLRSGRVVQVRGAGSDELAAGTAVRLCLRNKRYTVYSASDGNQIVGQAIARSPEA